MKKLLLISIILLSITSSFAQLKSYSLMDEKIWLNVNLTKLNFESDTLRIKKLQFDGDNTVLSSATPVAFDTSAFLSNSHIWSGLQQYSNGLRVTTGKTLRIYDATNTDALELSDNGSTSFIKTVNNVLLTNTVTNFDIQVYPTAYAGYAKMDIKGFGSNFGTLILSNASNTSASTGVTAAGRILGKLGFGACAVATSLSPTTTTGILAVSVENISPTAQGADLALQTCLRATATAVTRLRLKHNGGVVYPPVNTGNITASVGITEAMLSADSRYNGDSPVNITASVQIAPGDDGQVMSITGTSDTNTLTLDNGNGLVLSGTVVLGLNDVIYLKYVATSSAWVQDRPFQNN